MSTLRDFSQYPIRRNKAKKILNQLYHHGKYENRRGFATPDLFKDLGEKGGIGVAQPAFHGMLVEMQGLGWVKMRKEGRRTFSIELVEVPEDWEPETEKQPEPAPVVEATVTEPPYVTETGKVLDEPAIEALVEEAETGYDISAQAEAQELGMRPGRLAARIERTLPGMVEEAVANALMGILKSLIPPREIVKEDTESAGQIQVLRSKIQELDADLRVERQMHDAAREELNRELRKSYSITEGSPLGVRDVQESYRELARHALQQGWTISRTSGSHLRWRSPIGKVVFTGSTDSDWRSVKNARADLEKAGLPKQ